MNYKVDRNDKPKPIKKIRIQLDNGAEFYIEELHGGTVRVHHNTHSDCTMYVQPSSANELDLIFVPIEFEF